eukprot:201869-Lingulodinium_polyedra.AAC.1
MSSRRPGTGAKASERRTHVGAQGAGGAPRRRKSFRLPKVGAPAWSSRLIPRTYWRRLGGRRLGQTPFLPVGTGLLRSADYWPRT